MCGIFGIIAKSGAGLDRSLTEQVMRELFVLSESRGKESSGIAIRDAVGRTIHVTKDDVPATDLIRSEAYRSFLDQALAPSFANGQQELALIAHSRLVTNGSQ